MNIELNDSGNIWLCTQNPQKAWDTDMQYILYV